MAPARLLTQDLPARLDGAGKAVVRRGLLDNAAGPPRRQTWLLLDLANAHGG